LYYEIAGIALLFNVHAELKKKVKVARIKPFNILTGKGKRIAGLKELGVDVTLRLMIDWNSTVFSRLLAETA
jgi:hypothetical protein